MPGPRTPYHNRRNKVYRALLIATVRRTDLQDLPECDERGAPYGLYLRDIEPFVPSLDWKQLKYVLTCLVAEGRVFKTEGRRGVYCRFWPLRGLELVKKDRQVRQRNETT